MASQWFLIEETDANIHLILPPVTGILGTLWGNNKGIVTAESKVL